jgi:hyperosmotically inducible periplasmic protein
MEFHPTALAQVLVLAFTVSIFASGCDKREGATGASVSGTTVGTEIDDSVVTTRVRSALLADPDVKSIDIKVETRKGTVQLSGFVDSQERIDKAIALVLKVEGVKGVENGMSLRSDKATVGNTVDDSVITTRVKSALFADPGVKSFDISVVTRKGEVQLSGYVDNRTQINRVIEIVRAVEGVQSVNNEMTVKK